MRNYESFKNSVVISQEKLKNFGPLTDGIFFESVVVILFPKHSLYMTVWIYVCIQYMLNYAWLHKTMVLLSGIVP